LSPTPSSLAAPSLAASQLAAAAPSFADLGAPPWLVRNLGAHRIHHAFPIQAATIPDALAGRDLCGRAPTGSGKTIAFGVPLVVATGRRARPRRPLALVLVPTRELAAQVTPELQHLAGRTPQSARVEAFYGGVGFDKQLRSLRKGVDIAVACPGRLADLIRQRHLDLDEVEMVVVDEADRMADMGFLPDVKRLLDRCPDDRQTLLFSATLDGEVDVLISRYQRDPVRHDHIGDDDQHASLAEHHFWTVDRADRISTTAAVVDAVGSTVVFCRTKRGADRVARQLESFGVRAAAIHGDRSQAQRERALEAFHRGRVAALVATDVAARGIHVDDVACVVHFDPPGDEKDYVHRSGRTARAGNRGLVISLCPADVKANVKRMQRALGQPLGFAAVDLELLGSQPTRRPTSAPAPAARRSPRPKAKGAGTRKRGTRGPAGNRRRTPNRRSR
jgi:superfamily II DNA/RNA helicase